MGHLKTFRETYPAAQIGESLDSDSAVVTQWRPPEPGVVKINVDVALPAGRDFFRIGLIARDSDGNVVWWQVKKMDGRPTPVDGEAMAVLHGVLLTRNKDWRQVVIETDSLQVFRSFSLPSNSRSLLSFGALIDDCLARRSSFQSLSFSFIRRLGNVLAHELATDLVIPCDEGASLPSWLV